MYHRFSGLLVTSFLLSVAVTPGKNSYSEARRVQAGRHEDSGAVVAAHPGSYGENTPPKSLNARPPVLVSGVSIKPRQDGVIFIDVATTRAIAYRVFQLRNPPRLVVDLNGTRKGIRQSVFPLRSDLLKRVRMSQWKLGYPPVVRLVADLEGNPRFRVLSRRFGVRIELEPSFSGAPRPSLTATRKPQKRPARSEKANPLLPPRRAAHPAAYPALTASLELPAPSRVSGIRPHNRERVARSPDGLALVSGISIKPHTDGKTLVNVATTHSTPYRVFQLTKPARLVVDFTDARRATRFSTYPAHSDVLRRVRVGQWKSFAPAVVRVVADLEGWPVFDVHAQSPGVRIDLRPRDFVPPPTRNPFAYLTPESARRWLTPRETAEQSAATAPANPTATPGVNSSNLSFLGFVEQQGSETEAIVSDDMHIHLVREGDWIEGRFQILKITSRALEIEDNYTNQIIWVKAVPAQ